MLPVPLNSSKITSSIRLPVSISAVAMMREAAALVDVARRAEEALGLLQRVGVDAAREDLARVRHHDVVGPGQTGDRVEQDDHVAAVLHQPLGLLDHHVGHLHVAVGRLVEGGGDDLRLDVLLHVGDFLGPLVDQQHDEHDLGMVLADGVGQLLQQDRLAGLGRRHDQAALALADRARAGPPPACDRSPFFRSSRMRSSG